MILSKLTSRMKMKKPKRRHIGMYSKTCYIYLHVDNMFATTPNNCSFSQAAATRSLSFNCLFT